MATKRTGYSDNQHSILYGETRGFCPLCMQPIIFRKQGSNNLNKGYEIAHIYPLNPTSAQTKALVKRVPPPEINALENVIALCPTCHTKFDKDFLVEEMDKLRLIKDGFLADAKARETASQYKIQEEIYAILDHIAELSVDVNEIPPIRFDISTVDKKLRVGMSPLQKHEIKVNAVTFYVPIRDYIRELEQNDQLAIRILQSQINTYYLEMQKQHPDNKDAVFSFVAEWISNRTRRTLLASRVLTSFFVQNCEVFDVSAE
ncbi:HNH endonuclease [Alcaligenes aquatilis]|uniref:ABC-three component system protein n=1 Tax=Alcaligenes aquatilis TaxID=323284 RepID=UPI000F67F0AE|nr:ABC-three component system protein [Alcaligenes aquatilis]QXR34719.1 HNH endonuclease [Alcaligenes aquatilis]